MIASDAIYFVSSVHNLWFMVKVQVAKKFRLNLSAGIKLRAEKAKPLDWFSGLSANADGRIQPSLYGARHQSSWLGNMFFGVCM